MSDVNLLVKKILEGADVRRAISETSDQNTWYTINNKGDVGAHDVSRAKAEADLEWNRENYPDEEWEMFNAADDNLSVNKISEGVDVRRVLAETNYKGSTEDYNALKDSKELDALWSAYNNLIRGMLEEDDTIEDIEVYVTLNPDCTIDFSAEISGEGFTKQYFTVSEFKKFLADIDPLYICVDVKKSPNGGIRVKNKSFTSLVGCIKVLTGWFKSA